MQKRRYLPSLLSMVLTLLLFSGCDEILKLIEGEESLEAPVFVGFRQPYGIDRLEIEWTWSLGATNFQVMGRDVTHGLSFVEIFWGNSKNYTFIGNSMPETTLVPGHQYEFKVRAHSEKAGFGPFSEPGIYRVPAFIPPPGPTAALSASGDRIILSWTAVEGADGYRIYRSTSLDGYYTQLNGNPNSPSFEDRNFTPGDELFYKVTAHSPNFGESEHSVPFGPSATSSLAISGAVLASGTALGNVSLSLSTAMPTIATTATDGRYSFGNLAPGDYTVTPSLTGYAFNPASVAVTVGTSSVTGADFVATPVISYNWSNVGIVIWNNQLTYSGYGFATGAISLVADSGGVPIAGYVSLGSPSEGTQYAGALKYPGLSWISLGANNDGGIPSSLPDASPGSYRLSLAADGGTVYLATRDSSTVFIHRTGPADLAWSANLADGSFGTQGSSADTPKEIEIACYNSALYAAQIASDYNVKVLKYDGSSSWTGAGGTAGVLTASGKAWDLAFDNLGGTLTLAYTEDMNSDGYEDRLTIAQWSGTGWQTQLVWSQNYLAGLRIQRAGGSLYFFVGSSYPSTYSGGLYRVTGSSSAVLVGDVNLYGGVAGLTVNSTGELFVLGEVWDSAASASAPRIYRWNGTVLAQISGDYSGKMRGGALLGVGSDIYSDLVYPGI